LQKVWIINIMKKYKSIVDHIWNCGCGSMNSPYRNVCGFCGAENKNSDNQEIEKTIKNSQIP
jgi:hypothetical protein